VDEASDVGGTVFLVAVGVFGELENLLDLDFVIGDTGLSVFFDVFGCAFRRPRYEHWLTDDIKGSGHAIYFFTIR